jgi:hypothetical protein
MNSLNKKGGSSKFSNWRNSFTELGTLVTTARQKR